MGIIDDIIGKLLAILIPCFLNGVLPHAVYLSSISKIRPNDESFMFQRKCHKQPETTQEYESENKHSVKHRLGVDNVNNATVVKVATNLIVYPGLGSDEKLKLTIKLDVEATVLSVLFRNHIINIFENQIDFKSL
jgi:hypothetical protein